MHRLKVKESGEDKRHAKAITKYIEREKWKKLKKYLTEEEIHPGKTNFGLGLNAKCCKPNCRDIIW